MNHYNLRPAPKLIDPSLLGRVNKVYIGRTNENNFILDWIYRTIYPHFRDNFLFTMIVLLLVGYLIYRFLETIKKKNRIISNIVDDKQIEVKKLDKPIDYNANPEKKPKEKFKQNNEELNLSEISNISEVTNLSAPENIVFDKDIERGLQMGDNTKIDRDLNNMPPEMVRQQILQQQMNQQQMNHQQNNNQPNNQYMGNQSMGRHSMVDPSMNALQRNMNQMNDPNVGSCAVSFKTSSLIEPKALNTFSDNFMNFDLL
jgi:hypothetical protein